MKISAILAGHADLRRFASAFAERLRRQIERDLQAGMPATQDDSPSRNMLAQAIRRLSRS
jgi:hypothetical protein